VVSLRILLAYTFILLTLPGRLLSPSWWRDWNQRHRLLFRYHDGAQWQAIDPLVAVIGLSEHPQYRGDLHPRLVEQGDQEAIQITLRAVKDVFRVQDYDRNTGLGLTLGEQLQLLYTFSRYLELLKKSTDLSPIPPSSMASTSTGSTAPEAAATTNNS
jgi:hypothetical protein